MGRLGACVLGLLACWLAAGSSSARAEGSLPLVFFYAAERESPAATQARGALEEVALRNGSVVIDLSPAADTPSNAGVHLQHGIEAYRRFAYEEALGYLEKGVAEASASGALGLSHSELSDLLIYRALVLGQLGDAARAWDDFVRAATVDPTRKLDPVRFAPRIVETFDRAVQAVVARPSIPLEVGTGENCAARLDAREVASGTVVTVPEGEHYVRVECEGMVAYGARVMIRGERYTLRPQLQPRRAPTVAEVTKEARTRGADEILWCVLGTAHRGGVTLALRRIEVATGKEKAAVLLRLAGNNEDRAAVVGAATRLIETRPATESPVSRSTPWYRRPWFWAAVGVVATSAALLPFTLESDRANGFDVRVDYPR